MNSVHIVAEIWSASFYRTAVNCPTMSERYTAGPVPRRQISLTNFELKPVRLGYFFVLMT